MTHQASAGKQQQQQQQEQQHSNTSVNSTVTKANAAFMQLYLNSLEDLKNCSS